MQIIDFINKKGYKVLEFPDGELHLELEELNRKEFVDIKCRIKSSNDLFLLMQLSDILKRQAIIVREITIYYLMGMRCDRVFDFNRPFTLSIIANVINSFNAEIVTLYSAHSDRALQEIKNSQSQDFIHTFYNTPKTIARVAPDKGAVQRYALNFDVICNKKCDVSTGKLLDFEVETKRNVEGLNLVVIDDLCDGGGTFVGLAPKLRELNPNSLSLYVTHAIQLEGIKRVADVYDSVFITDSYEDWKNYILPANVHVNIITKL